MQLPLEIVDVFAERRFAGNQLAVVRDAGGLTDQQMQDIAREMHFSETTFVLDEQAGIAKVRIFTPEWELPFAGHPTLGTAWVLAGGHGEYTLDLQAGHVPVRFADGIGFMEPPEVSFQGDYDHSAELLGLPADALHPDYPPMMAEVGPRFVLIGLTSLAHLRAIRLHEGLRARLLADGVQCVFAFTEDSYEPAADFASRMFFDSGGPREDAATGSASTAFAAYLRHLRGGSFEVVVDQGVEINRPSRLCVLVGDTLRVGGRVFPVVQGLLSV